MMMSALTAGLRGARAGDTIWLTATWGGQVRYTVGAVVDDAGAEVVYVQLGGERFERRVVRTGLRDGQQVAITEGLAPRERVVSRGAFLVHLAAGAPAEAGHGHAH